MLNHATMYIGCAYNDFDYAFNTPHCEPYYQDSTVTFRSNLYCYLAPSIQNAKKNKDGVTPKIPLYKKAKKSCSQCPFGDKKYKKCNNRYTNLCGKYPKCSKFFNKVDICWIFQCLL